MTMYFAAEGFFSFLSFDFMRRALLAALLIAPLLAMLGGMAVSRRMAFFSDALGHSALTGVGLGVVLGMARESIAMLIFGIVWALLLCYINRKGVASADTIISVFSSTAIALGLVILSRGGGFAKYSSYLLGDILAVTADDIIMLAVALVIVAAVWVLLYNRLLLVSLSPSLAASRGINTAVYEYVFSVLLALVVMLSIRWVGIMLINAFLILPAAAARNLAHSVRCHMAITLGFAVFAGVGGLLAGYWLDISCGAAMVLLAALCFFISLPFSHR